MRIETHARSDLGKALAARVASDLRAALAMNGRASLAVPGGTTPAPFLTALGDEVMDWEKVTVTLTDERCVPPTHERSNERLLRETLLHRVPATFAALDAVEAILPLDVCVLGMGNDMHTASLFPTAPELAAALKGINPTAMMTPPDQGEKRITLTAPVLAAAQHVYLLITGAEKRAALDTALATGDPMKAPIRAILDNADVTVFYAE